MIFTRMLLVAGFFGASAASALPQEPQHPQSAAVAFINVNVVPLDSERVEPRRTVLVRGDRIVVVGSGDQVNVPRDAVVIDGAGQFLVPGLTDAHVHLAGSPLVSTRDDFGDAPIYLAYGITTVVNLSGSPTLLEWRKRVEAGTLLGPTIYTSGPFVNEPRVKTPEEVERDIIAQARLGYDLVKFHEFIRTTTGLSRPAYRRMIETARRSGLPLIGHAPVNLGIDEMLQARQSIAHLGMLSNIYFLPFSSHTKTLLITGVATLVLIGLAFMQVVRAIVRRWSKEIRGTRSLERLSTLNGSIALIAVIAFVCAFSYLPGGPLFDSAFLRVVFTAATGVTGAATLIAGFYAVGVFRDATVPMIGRMQVVLGLASAIALTIVMASFWVPVSWRSSNSGIDNLAKRIHNAGLFVDSTLIAYETFNTRGRTELIEDRAIDFLTPPTREGWRHLPKSGVPFNHFTAFNQKVAGALHRNDVPIMAGTDALGLDLVPPGSSLHREFQLLSASGLSSYEVMRSATVVPAVFLGKTNEFGIIAAGQRADLLLVAGNPLDDLSVLERPSGVMVRGNWLPRSTLDERLKRLANGE
ncbi:MAG TPA: amidohydrolase family protein [Vicinamibacterales bacterium]|nr:amidohydrolase family protein [Vicinamibacterales bacterium]